MPTNGTFKPTETNRILTVTATLSGSGNLTVSGRGVVNLSGAHSYNGPVTITGTTLDMDGTTVMTPSAWIVGKDATLVTGHRWRHKRISNALTSSARAET